MVLFKKKLLEPFFSQDIFKTKLQQYTVGKYTYGVPKVYDWREGTTLAIGSYCSISSNVKIYLGGHHRDDWVTTYPFPAFFKKAQHIKNFGGTNGDVTIGSDVCIYANVTILSGITIGHGAVIANGSVVTKSVKPYEVVGGNPAKHIKYRFNEEQINALLQSEWWSWSHEEIESVVELLCSDDINAFIDYTQQR